MITSSEILIHLNLQYAIKEGFNFYLSENEVIVSSGINKIICTTYFKKVICTQTGIDLLKEQNRNFQTIGTERPSSDS